LSNHGVDALRVIGSGAADVSSSAMTRDSNVESKRTGRLNSTAIFSMKGSISCSDTVCLLKKRSQPLAGALHTHLQRRHSDAGQLRHFLVSHLLDVLQQKRFALIVVQL